MKPGQKPRFPRPQSILRDTAILGRAVPMDGEPQYQWRHSYSGAPNLRVEAVTNGVRWIVDLYCGHYYRVQVDGSLGEVWRSMRALIGYLHRRLNIALQKPSGYAGCSLPASSTRKKFERFEKANNRFPCRSGI